MQPHSDVEGESNENLKTANKNMDPVGTVSGLGAGVKGVLEQAIRVPERESGGVALLFL